MAEQTPLVTIYVVNHNYDRYVATAIDSALAQTMRDFEIIVIDDGSTDGSREVIERYRETAGVYIIHQHNKGLNVTNNIALRAARGRYVVRLDADDYLDPNALAVLAGTLERHPEIGMVFPDYYLVDEAGTVIDVVRRHDFDDVTLMDQPAHGACTMMRRELLEELGGYDETFSCQDGYELWLRFIERFKVKNVNLPLFYYRQHSASLTKNESRILSTRAEILKKQALTKGRKLRTLAVIPVRDQKTDPRSIALERLGDKLVIDWTIEAALAAERVTDVLLTTPDDRILEHVTRRYGASVMAIKRDRSLAQMNSFTRPTLWHAAQTYGADRPAPDAVAELFIEFPFRSPHVIDSAIDLLEIFGTDRVIGVRPEVSNFYAHEGAGLVPLRGARRLKLESEELYRDVGSVMITRTQFLEDDRALDTARLGHAVVDQLSAFCIRSEWDWDIARFEAERRKSAVQPVPKSIVGA